INATLKLGSNTINASASAAIGGGNVDSLTVKTATTYQAETAALAGGTVTSHANTGYSGTGYVDFGGTNSSITLAITHAAAGNATLAFRYANGGATNRPIRVSVNGVVVGSLNFGPTGSWST